MSRLWIALAPLVLLACGGPSPSSAPAPAVAPGLPRDALGRLVEAYWDDTAAYRADPLEPIEISALADARALEQRYLQALLAMPRPTSGPAALTYEVFRRERALALLGYTFPAELMPVNPFHCAPLTLAARAGATEALSSDEAQAWVARSEEFAHWTDAAIGQLRDGLRRGYLEPKVLVQETLPELAVLAADTPENPFNAGLHSPTAALAAAVREKLLPSYQRLHAFLESEYLPRARAGVALSELPLGEAWYAYRIRLNAGGAPLGANELHALALAELERLQGKVQAVLAEGGFEGALAAYLETLARAAAPAVGAPAGSAPSESEPVAWLRARDAEAVAAAPALFAALPRAAPTLRLAPPFLATRAPFLRYQPAGASTPSSAVLWINPQAGTLSDPLRGGWSRVLREDVPGHHLERSLAAARAELPRFRRFGGDRAFIEGWGLYAASLGEELGIARDVPGRLGPLLQEMECASGAVLDTGLHTGRMSRAQAIDFLRARLPVPELEARRSVDRIIALPGEALACDVGLRKIRALRAEAQLKLGARFELRAFHQALLEQGALPLDLLEASLHRWMEEGH